MHFSSYFRSVLFHLPRFVRSLLRRFFFAYAIRCLLRRAIPGTRGPDWPNGALNEVAIKRAKSYAAELCLLKASGLARAYFRFWLASSFPTSSSPALPSPPPSSRPPPAPVLSLLIILFPSLFFSSRFPFTSLLVVSLYLPACALSRTVGIRACDSRREGGSSYSRFSPRWLLSFRVDSRSSRSIRATTRLRPVDPHLLILPSYRTGCNIHVYVKSDRHIWEEISFRYYLLKNIHDKYDSSTHRKNDRTIEKINDDRRSLYS